MNLTPALVILLALISLTACSSSPGVSVASNTNDPLSGSNSTDTSQPNEGLTSNDDSAGINAENPEVLGESQITDKLIARHRSGQTFILWPESSTTASYNVYRYSQPITSDNLNAATLLTSRWGPLGPDTSVNQNATALEPKHFVVSDLSQPLSDDTGLFVYTIPEDENARSYYAVTAIKGGREDKNIMVGKNSLITPIQESADRPKPVLIKSTNDGKGRVYTQYMDYNNWNPTLNGYAFSYTVTLPFNYDPAIAYPLQLRLHAFGEEVRFQTETEYQWEAIKVAPTDPGGAQNTIHTWWYGYAADHNYITDGDIPTSGTIENFTEQRVLSAVRDVIENPALNVNTDLIHIIGHSMGASGALSLGLRYPNVFSGIYASEPMTNYASSPTFQGDFVRLWGNQRRNLPIENNGPDSASIKKYDINGTTTTGVWNWMNHLEQVRVRNFDQFAYLMIDHGKTDTTIDWNTQGRPLSRALTEAKVGFSASALEATGHAWLGFRAVVNSQFGLGYGEESSWRYPNSLSYPAISNASGSSAVDPDLNGDSSYNKNIEWSAAKNEFDQPIVDTRTQYQISIRSVGSNQTASITPRNTGSFRTNPGQRCNWSVIRNSDRQLIQSGTATTDGAGLITIDGMSILSGSGSRLAIDC